MGKRRWLTGALKPICVVFAHEKPNTFRLGLSIHSTQPTILLSIQLLFKFCTEDGAHLCVPGETKLADLEEQLLACDKMLKLLRSNHLKAQSWMKSQADSKRCDLSFEVDDAVLIRLQPYRQKRLTKRTNEKLSPRYFGPYTIVRKLGPVAYEL